MTRKDLTENEKLGILKRLAQTPKPSQEVVAEETHHGKRKIGRLLKDFRTMSWEEARASCGNNEQILRLRNDYSARRVAEESEARVKAEQASARLESEKDTVLVRLVVQAKQAAAAAGELYIDPFTGGLVI